MIFWTIKEVYVLPPPMNQKIRLMPQTLLTTGLKEIFTDVTPGNTWTNKTPQRISRNVVDGSIPISPPIHSGISKSSTPASSDITVTMDAETRIPIGTTAPPCGLRVSPNIDDIQQSATPDLRKSNKLYTSIDGQFTNNLVAPPIFTEVISDKLSDISIQDIYTHCRMNLTADPVNKPVPQFVYLRLYTINSLYKGASIWTPLPELEVPQMLPIGARQIIFLEKLQRSETLRAQSQTITIKIILKLGGKIRNFRAKIIQGVGHL